MTIVLRAQRAKPKSLCSIFSESFWDNCWKGSADREHLQALSTKAQSYEIGQELWKSHPHLAALIIQHLTSVPPRIKRNKLHIFKLAFNISNYISDFSSFKSMHSSLCLWTQSKLEQLHRTPHTWSELQRPAKLCHSRQAMGKSASHRAGLLFKNSKFHTKKRVVANFYYCSSTSNKNLPCNCQITPPLPIFNSAFKFLYKHLIYTRIF